MPKLSDFLHNGEGIPSHAKKFPKEEMKNQQQLAKTKVIDGVDNQQNREYDLDPNKHINKNHTIYSIVATFTGYIREMFKNFEDFEWSQNETESKIVIDSIFSDARNDEDVPAIIVTYDSMNSDRLSLGGVGRQRHTYVKSEKQYKTEIVRRNSMNILIRCLAEGKKTSVDLATIIFDAITCLAADLSVDFGIEFITNETITPVRELPLRAEDSITVYESDVVFSLMFIRTLNKSNFSEWYESYKLQINMD